MLELVAISEDGKKIRVLNYTVKVYYSFVICINSCIYCILSFLKTNTRAVFCQCEALALIYPQGP